MSRALHCAMVSWSWIFGLLLSPSGFRGAEGMPGDAAAGDVAADGRGAVCVVDVLGVVSAREPRPPVLDCV